MSHLIKIQAVANSAIFIFSAQRVNYLLKFVPNTGL